MKDQRYKAIKSLIETKSIQSLKDIFTIIPITVVRNDLKVNYNTIRRRIDKPELLTLKDIILLADLFEVESFEVFKLAENDFKKQNRKPHRKKE